MTNIQNESYYHWYNSNDKLRMHYPSESVIGFLKSNIKPGSKVLDLGCGSGRHVLVSAELGYEAFGLDLSSNGFKFCQIQAQKKELVLNLKTAPMDDTGYSDCFFDAIICIGAISGNTFSEQKKIISEIQRILKKDGYLLISFYGEKDSIVDLWRKVGKKISEYDFIIPGNHFHPFSKNRVPDYLGSFSTPTLIEMLLASFNKVVQYEIYLPIGNANLQKDAKPSHELYAVAKK